LIYNAKDSSIKIKIILISQNLQNIIRSAKESLIMNTNILGPSRWTYKAIPL